MSNMIIGLTGGIGSGKTAACEIFANLGITIVDADVIARQVVEPDTPAYHAIVEKFGRQCLLASGELDRQYLRRQVFEDPTLKDWLNQLLHPQIREQMIEQASQATSAYCILAIPLLIENRLQELVDRILVVDVTEATQMQRAAIRDDVSIEHIQAIMAAQTDRQTRLAAADDVVSNEGNLHQLTEQIEKIHQSYLKISEISG